MTKKKEDIIRFCLPALPHSWVQLSAEEVERINRYMLKKQQRIAAGMSPAAADMDFKLKCFLLLTDLRCLRRTAKSREGETVYFFRRRGWRHLLERIPMQSWQIVQWIEHYLGWLDKPMGLLVCPYTYIKVGGRKFKAPDALMQDVTRLQYFTAQNLLSAHWDAVKTADYLLRNNGTRQAIKEQLKLSGQAKLQFLACLFTPESREIEVRTDTSVRRVDRTVYAYDDRQADDNARLFRRHADRLFPVMQQFFQSVQQHYATMFPDLFTSHTTTAGHRDYLKMEVDQLNAIIKYEGFSSYEEINRANAVLILGVLDNMSREAKEIKAMNEKTKRR